MAMSSPFPFWKLSMSISSSHSGTPWRPICMFWNALGTAPSVRPSVRRFSACACAMAMAWPWVRGCTGGCPDCVCICCGIFCCCADESFPPCLPSGADCPVVCRNSSARASTERATTLSRFFRPFMSCLFACSSSTGGACSEFGSCSDDGGTGAVSLAGGFAGAALVSQEKDVGASLAAGPEALEGGPMLAADPAALLWGGGMPSGKMFSLGIGLRLRLRSRCGGPPAFDGGTPGAFELGADFDCGSANTTGGFSASGPASALAAGASPAAVSRGASASDLAAAASVSGLAASSGLSAAASASGLAAPSDLSAASGLSALASASGLSAASGLLASASRWGASGAELPVSAPFLLAAPAPSAPLLPRVVPPPSDSCRRRAMSKALGLRP
mmetsp:Transcript_63817/g.177033  ORF Transcript_63817/g.177033 Transcript_63817/m.177033 type:complete len:388 (-) Transcript_63817:329-1492(-)